MKLNLSKPTSSASAFAQKHRITGVPTIIFLGPAGKEVLGQFSGYRDADAYLGEMQSVLDFIKLREEYARHPEDIELNLKLGLAYLERNRTEDAAPMVERVLAADPDNAKGYALQIYAKQALSLIGQGEFEAAAKELKRVEQYDKAGAHLPEIYFQMGYELGNRSRMDEALTYFEKVMDLYPESEAADSSLFFAGLVHSIQKQDDQALALLRKYVAEGKNKQYREHAQGEIKRIEKRQ